MLLLPQLAQSVQKSNEVHFFDCAVTQQDITVP